jgi:hypothetical protein
MPHAPPIWSSFFFLAIVVIFAADYMSWNSSSKFISNILSHVTGYSTGFEFCKHPLNTFWYETFRCSDRFSLIILGLFYLLFKRNSKIWRVGRRIWGQNTRYLLRSQNPASPSSSSSFFFWYLESLVDFSLFLEVSQQNIFMAWDSSPKPNPQPGGLGCPFVSGPSPLICLAREASPVATLQPAKLLGLFDHGGSPLPSK